MLAIIFEKITGSQNPQNDAISLNIKMIILSLTYLIRRFPPFFFFSVNIVEIFDRVSKKIKKLFYPADLVIKFKNFLIRWIVHFQIAFIAVENEYFYNFLDLCKFKFAIVFPAVGDTVRR
jgi:hypothetical protein